MNKIYEDLTIVTVLYDSSELINDLLKNLINFKVIVVDNGNNEQILKKLSDFKNVKVITQKKNLGYGRAINFAFEKIKSKYFFVLNPDLVISEKSIYDLYVLITKNPDREICEFMAGLELGENMRAAAVYPLKIGGGVREGGGRASASMQ